MSEVEKRNNLDAARLKCVLKKASPQDVALNTSPKFGECFTNHMIEADWNAETGWGRPIIHPFSNLEIHPASGGLHYGLQVFEGLKAFRQENKIVLFRADRHISRLRSSCQRMSLPIFDEKALLSLIATLVHIDQEFVPYTEGYALYIRPIIFATQSTLGIHLPCDAKLVVVCFPTGSYFAKSKGGISILADLEHIRAWPGGTGACKAGGNYGPTIQAQAVAEKSGCSQTLWLFPDGNNDYYITEAGAMNLFIYWQPFDNTPAELVTYPLDDGLVLPGVTRDTIITLAREASYPVREDRVRIQADFLVTLSKSRVYEVFGCGTAVGVCSIKTIVYKDKKYNIPLGRDDCGRENGIGPLAQEFLQKMRAIQHGTTTSEKQWTLNIDHFISTSCYVQQ